MQRDQRTAHYDVVERRALDACVVVPFWRRGEQLMISLRTVVRPPLTVRGAPPSDVPTPPAVLWEIPAGLVEPGESALEAARRELVEELGVEPLSIAPLGPPVCPAPALIGELHVFFVAELPAPEAAPRTPAGDGSLYEEAPAFAELPLSEALDACAHGEVWDSKTELGLRRFADYAARGMR